MRKGGQGQGGGEKRVKRSWEGGEKGKRNLHLLSNTFSIGQH